MQCLTAASVCRRSAHDASSKGNTRPHLLKYTSCCSEIIALCMQPALRLKASVSSLFTKRQHTNTIIHNGGCIQKKSHTKEESRAATSDSAEHSPAAEMASTGAIASTAGLSLSSPSRRRRPEIKMATTHGRPRLIATDTIKQGEQLIAAPRASARDHEPRGENAPRELKRGLLRRRGLAASGLAGAPGAAAAEGAKDESDLRGWFDALPVA